MYNILFSSDIRTNNYLESFHATLLNQMGKHPNILNFLCKLNFIKYLLTKAASTAYRET